MDSNAITQFAGITGSSDHIAAQYLGFAEGNIEQAMELYYANDGADLQASSTSPHQSQAPSPAPPPSARPAGHMQGYEDDEGIVHLDSDHEDHDHDYEDDDDDNDEIEITGQSRRQLPAAGRPSSPSRTPMSTTPPVGRPGANVDDDEAMARRLQEEFYGVAGRGGGSGNGSSEVLDEHGYRAPIRRTTETLVGPGSFDPSNAEEMRAAVMEQMRARRQPSRHRGKSLYNRDILGYATDSHRPTWYLQPSYCALNMERRKRAPRFSSRSTCSSYRRGVGNFFKVQSTC